MKYTSDTMNAFVNDMNALLRDAFAVGHVFIGFFDNAADFHITVHQVKYVKLVDNHVVFYNDADVVLAEVDLSHLGTGYSVNIMSDSISVFFRHA